MKKIILLIFSFLNFIVFSQNSINVNITQDCSAISSQYNFVGMFNGKEKFSKTFTNGTQSETFSVLYSNTNIWIIQNESNQEIGFYNNNLNGNLPPSNNWINSECDNGNMSITFNLGIKNINLFKSNYDYNSQNIVVVKEDNLQEIKIINSIGLKIKEYNNIKNNIDLRDLNVGIYFVILKNNQGQIETFKILKNNL